MSDIVFVCTGNTCRSPMAEVLAAAIFLREGINFRVASAGVSAMPGMPASENAAKAMREEGLELSSHRSKPASKEFLQGAKLVLTMTRGHLEYVRRSCPDVRAFTLGEYASIGKDISDPFGGSLEVYRNCAADIKALLVACAKKIKKIDGNTTGGESENE